MSVYSLVSHFYALYDAPQVDTVTVCGDFLFVLRPDMLL